MLETLRYNSEGLQILDQLRLPHEEVYLKIDDPQKAWDAIKSMQVRGAPAIAIVACLSLAVFLASNTRSTIRKEREAANVEAADFVSQNLKYLVTSRPTAVNLADAAMKLEKIAYAAAKLPDATENTVNEAYIAATRQMLSDDVSDNRNIGRYGAEWIMQNARSESQNRQVRVLTHCNTGSLATAAYGTALGVVRSLHELKILDRAFYTETRPYNQGSRLTGYELIHDKIPATLITDSMAAALLKLKDVSCIIVGADRVAANGDTANKIGTYSLAILAKFHKVKFLVAAPRTTIDMKTPSGAQIVVEERSPIEVTLLKGPVTVRQKDGGLSVDKANIQEIYISATGTDAWNPAFDVTPAELIDGIITEKGVIEKSADGCFHFESIFEMEKVNREQNEGAGNVSGLPTATQQLLVTGQSLQVPEGKISWKVALSMPSSKVPSWLEWIELFEA